MTWLSLLTLFVLGLTQGGAITPAAQASYTVQGRLVPAEPETVLRSSLGAGFYAEALTGPDGTFILAGLSSGTRGLELVRPGKTPLFVGNLRVENNVTGVVLLNGQIRLDDGKPLPPSTSTPRLSVQASVDVPGRPAPLQTAAANVEPDGTFFLLLPQGGHRLAVRYIPWGYAVRSFTSGAVDLQMALLEVSANTTPGPIRATLAAAPTTGVQVKGRLTGLPPGVTQNAQVTLIQIGSSNQKALTSPGADGGFVFSSVPPGFYHVFLTPPAVGGGQSAILYPRLWTIHTGDQGIANIVSRGMIISGFADGGLGLANTTPPNIRGQVIVRDEAGATPSLPSGLAVRSSGNSHIAGVAADGSFTLPVANGSHYPVLENVPPGYAITSMTLGSTDVLSTPFSVVVSALPTDELRIVLSFDRRAAEEGRNRIQLGSIAGRLLNSDGTPAVDVEVHAAPISFSPAASSTRTDMTGAYRLMDLPPGDYSLIVGPIEAMPSTARGRVVAAAGNTDLRTSLQYGKQIEIGTAVGFTQLISGARGTTVWYRLQN